MRLKLAKIDTASVLRWLFLYKGILWIMFGILHRATQGTWASGWIAFFLIVDAAIFLWLSRAIVAGKRWIWRFALALILANMILTLTDQIGIWDIAVLVVDAVVLSLLIAGRRDLARYRSL